MKLKENQQLIKLGQQASQSSSLRVYVPAPPKQGTVVKKAAPKK